MEISQESVKSQKRNMQKKKPLKYANYVPAWKYLEENAIVKMTMKVKQN